MFNEVEIIASATIGFGTGVALMILALKFRQKTLEEIPSSILSTEQSEKKIAPFIEVHKRIYREQKTNSSEDSINRLKDKIESFKHRNKFYKG